MNILQSLVNFAQQKKQQIQNDISNIGQAPRPVNTAPAPVVNAIQNARYGVLAHNPVAQNRVVQQLRAPVAPRPSIVTGLSNAGDALDRATMSTVVQPFVTRPAMEVAQSVRQQVTHKPSTYTPGSPAAQALFGSSPVASIQKKVGDQYKRQSTSSNPLLRLASRPLAAGEAALSVANDLPVVGGAVKGGAKVLDRVAPRAIPVAKVIAKDASAGIKAAQARVGTNEAVTAQQKQLQREITNHQKQIDNLPITNHKAAEVLQRKIDTKQGQIANLEATRPQQNIIQKGADRVLGAQPGMSMKAVNPELPKNPASNLDSILKYHEQNPRSVDLEAVKAEYKDNPAALKAIEDSQAKVQTAAAQSKVTAQHQALVDQKFSSAKTVGDIRQAEAMQRELRGQPSAPKATLAPAQPKPSAKPQLPASKGTGEGSLPNNSTAEHLKQQIAAQEAARKLGSPSGLDKLKAGTADIKAKMVDSLSPIEDRLNTKITADNATSHITPQLDRALRTDTIASHYIKENGLAKVIQNVPNTKEFDQYLIAKHAADLGKQGIKTGRNAAADAQLVKDLAGKYEPHAQALKQYSNSLLDKAAEYGLISKDLPAQLKEKYPNYVPANRIFGENELVKPPKGTAGGKASLGQQSVVQKIKGSNRVIESPLSSIIDKTHAVIDQGERNKAAQILTGYKDLPGNPFNLRELKPTETVGEKHVISVLDNGKTRRFETDPAIAAAAKSLNKEQLGLVGKILNAPVRVLRMGATSLNPAFTGANIVKDLVTGAINSSHPLRSSVANPEVFLQALKASLNHGSKEYGELVREGAGGTSFDIARGEAVNNVKSIRAQKNAGTKIAYTVTHPAQLFRAAENAIGRSEEFTRALQYYGNKSAATASGASEQAARVMGAHAARNNTTNFARSGDFGKVLNSVIPYLNAGFQGSRTLVRNLGDRPAQTTAKLVVGAFMPVAAATAWNVSDPKRKAAYDDIKQYEKQGNIIIVPPNPVKDPNTGKWNVIKIPLSQEVANLGDVVRNGVETGMKDGSLNVAGILGNLAGTATSLNLQSPRQAVGQVLPQAAKPAIEALTNQNLYTGNKIVPDSQKNLDPRDQYGSGTSGTAKVIGNVLNVSPRQIDNAVRTGVGGLGQNIINTSDNALAKLGVIQPADIKGTSFASAAGKRFSGAQGSSPYDVIDKQTADLTNQLKQLPGYKSMSNTDKAKALNRLQSTIVQTYNPNSTKNLSQRQQDIKNGKTDLSSYLTTASAAPSLNPQRQVAKSEQAYSQDQAVKTARDTMMKKLPPNMNGNDVATLQRFTGLPAAKKDAILATEPNADYKLKLAEFERDKHLGTISPTDMQTRQAAVEKAQVGSQFNPEVRKVYDMGGAKATAYLANNPNGSKLANAVIAYGDSLAKNGIENNKFVDNKGNVGIVPKGTTIEAASPRITQVAQKNGIPDNIFAALVKQESGGNQGAKSPVGAIGLTQLMPDTARSLGVDPNNADQNLDGGARYLKQMYDQFKSWPLALAAYNAGPAAVQKYGGIPPYAETQNYVKSIMGMVNGGIKGNSLNLVLSDPNAQSGDALNQSGVNTASASSKTATLTARIKAFKTPYSSSSLHTSSKGASLARNTKLIKAPTIKGASTSQKVARLPRLAKTGKIA